MERSPGPQDVINNAFYDALQEKWYTAKDHPVALLRAENAVRSPWVAREIAQRFDLSAKVLDIGCGAGFLTNYLAQEGYEVTGIDLSRSSLKEAQAYDRSKRVKYLYADAYDLPFEEDSFDVVCAMDILEHVEQPARLIQQASRVLRKGGLFFFHTFNRNLLSRLIVIKGVEWFVKNTPPNMHVYSLFITPQELTHMCAKEHIQVDSLIGFMPKVGSKAFWQMLWTRDVPEDFQFHFVKSLATGYCGIATKRAREFI